MQGIKILIVGVYKLSNIENNTAVCHFAHSQRIT